MGTNPLLRPQTVPNLINGVSQQPVALRLPSQCEAMSNGYPSPIEGLRKRPPTTEVARLVAAYSGIGDAPTDTFYAHFINRDAVEQYVLILSDRTIRVFSLIDGSEKTVTVDPGANLSYLDTNTAHVDLTALTIGDYTFIVNKTAVTAMAADLTPDTGGEALVFVKLAAAGTTYKVTINGSVAGTYTTADTGIPKTTDIAADLRTQIATAVGGGDWSVTVLDSTIRVRRPSHTDFTIQVEDTHGGDYLQLFKGKTQSFTSLPATAAKDLVIEVAGDANNSFDSYFVKFEPNNPSLTLDRGRWTECVKSGIQYKIDGATMPHVLVRQGDGTFLFKRFAWGDREAGDTDSNANPGFIGFAINDICLFRDRLVVVADNQISFSEVSEYGNWFSTTVTTVLASDPIHLGVSHTRPVKLMYAVPYNRTLLLFDALRSQFIVDTGREQLTSKTASVDHVTDFEMTFLCRPENIGRSVMFAFNRGTNGGVREFFVDIDSQQFDAADVTGHVQHYLGADIHRLAGTTTEDLLVAFSAADRTKVWAYKYFWQENKKLQSAWGEWSFNDCVVHSGVFIGSRLYLLIERNNRDIHLEYMDVAAALTDADQGHLPSGDQYLTHLDRRIPEVACAKVYDPIDDETAITLPYIPVSGTVQQVVSRAYDVAGNIPGIVAVGSLAGNVMTVQGDWSTTKFYSGQQYRFLYEPSAPLVKIASAGGGNEALTVGRTIARSISFTYYDLGYLVAEVTHTHRTIPSKFVLSGRRVGYARTRVNKVALVSGAFMVPIGADYREFNLTLTSDSFLPLHLVSAEWELTYFSRSRTGA